MSEEMIGKPNEGVELIRSTFRETVEEMVGTELARTMYPHLYEETPSQLRVDWSGTAADQDGEDTGWRMSVMNGTGSPEEVKFCNDMCHVLDEVYKQNKLKGEETTSDQIGLSIHKYLELQEKSETHGRLAQLFRVARIAPTGEEALVKVYEEMMQSDVTKGMAGEMVKNYYQTTTKIIAFDFDGTVATCAPWPAVGMPIWRTIEALQKEKENGAKLILWTSRTKPEDLNPAIEFCYKHGISPDAVNKNLHDYIPERAGDPRKVFATEYWDDKAVYTGTPYLSDAEKDKIIGVLQTIKELDMSIDDAIQMVRTQRDLR